MGRAQIVRPDTPRLVQWPALLILAAGLFASTAGSLRREPAVRAQPPHTSARSAAVSELQREGTYDSLRAAVRDAGYTVHAAGPTGVYAAENAAERLQARFTRAAVEIAPSVGARSGDRLRLRLTSWGRGRTRYAAPAGQALVRKARVEYRRGTVTEWYENRPQGIEQGFTVAGVQAFGRSVFRRSGVRMFGRSGDHPVRKGSELALTSERGPRRLEGAAGTLALRLSVDGGYRMRVAEDGGSAVFTSPRGGPALHYAGLRAWDARGRSLRAWMAGTGDGLELTVADRGAAYPITIDPLLTTEARLAADDGAAFDNFGEALAVSGNTALIGASHRNGSRGAAYVFTRTHAGWVQQAVLNASDAAPNDRFGFAVALQGETALVGAYQKNGSAGAAYVFVGAGGAWTQQAKLTAAGDSAGGNQYGWSVALARDTALVGSPGKGGNTGAAYAYERSGAVWTLQTRLTASDAASNDLFGTAVALSGETAVVGANGKSGNTGAAYVYARSGDSWSQQKVLAAVDAALNDFFGTSVGLSGETALVGAPGKSAAAGAAYLFVRSGINWSQQQKLTAPDGAANDQFGYSAAVSGNTALVGAFAHSSTTGTAYAFMRSGSFWTLQRELAAGDAASGDSFGYAVALAGTNALVGAFGKNGQTGAAYVESLVTGAALLLASDGTGPGSLGASIALSGDTALVGAPYKTGPGGPNSGAAYVFVRSGSGWSQEAKLTAPAADASTNDYFGFSVAVSGNTAVVGAYGENSLAGAAYVFVRSGTIWGLQQKLTAGLDAVSGDLLGYSVAVSGNTALAGAYAKDSLTGAAYAFTRSGGTWSSPAKLTASNAATGDRFGASVALSAETALVGAYGKNGFTGAAYVYVRSGGAWTQQWGLLAADAAANDYFGGAVAVSGNTALVGAYGKNTSAGAAYVFVRTGQVWSPQQKLAPPDGLGGQFGNAVALSGEKALMGAPFRMQLTGGADLFVRSGDVWAPQPLLSAADARAGDLFGSSVALSDDTVVVGSPNKISESGAYAFELVPYAPLSLAARALSPTEVALSWIDVSGIEEWFELERSVNGGFWAPVAVEDEDAIEGEDVGLPPGASCAYRIRGVNEDGAGDWSDPAFLTLPAGLPAAPSGLTATALSPGTVRVNWVDNAGNENGFELQRSANNTLWSTIGSLAANLVTATDNTALPNTTYFYRVRAVNAYGGSTSGAVSVTTPGAPPAPSGLVLTALGPTRVRIDWTDNSVTETSFEIDRSLNRTLWSTIGAVSANVISAVDESAEPGTFYWYRVRAVNGYGAATSASISVTTPDGLPAAPSGLIATAVSATQINLEWTDNSGNETSFEVEWRGNAGTASEPWLPLGTRDANASAAADLGLNPSSTYSYRVRAVNGVGASSWSAVATATTPAAGSAGVSLHAAGEKRAPRLRLSWTLKRGRSGAFVVERKEGGASGNGRFAPVGNVRAASGRWLDRQAAAGVRYSYRLRRDGGARPAFSNTASARAGR